MTSSNIVHLYIIFVIVQCGRDEQYYTCTPSCKNTCENCTNPAAKCACGPPGCFCREGLVKRADGKCLLPSQCPKRCSVDEEYYQCTPSCKNTCKNFRNPTALCQCGPPGCFCKRGLVKRADGKCVLPNQCPVGCRKVRRGRSHPIQCTTSREGRQIVRMAVMDRSVTSRTVAQHIESVTHHSVSARTIRRRLQQSGLSERRPLLGLHLTQNHRRLRRQWCDERRMWAAEWNEVVFTDESRICLQHPDGRIRVWRHRGERMLNSCVMHRHTAPATDITVWGGIGYNSRTPLVGIAGTLNSQRYISEVLEPVVLPYLQGLATAIFQQDNTRPHVRRFFKGSSSITILNCFPCRLALRIFH
ncbi:transposable element Tcb1 transposase [Trichonephila clavipes]|nr:transposable element Tcb1 transposase [Trichonephila clavipes]